MKINEVTEAIKPKVETHITHLEDAVIFGGSRGALRSIASIKTLLSDTKRESLSLKWDGSVALIIGRNDKGQFVMTDKHGWTAKKYDGKYTSAIQFVNQKKSKKELTPSLAAYLNKIVQLWPLMESVVPKSFIGYVWGDMLWFPGELGEKGNRYIFTPNTVTYEVDKNSVLGNRIAHSVAGFAIHTFIPTANEASEPLRTIPALNMDGPVCIVGPDVKNVAPLQYDKNKIKDVIKYIKHHASVIDTFLNADTLAALKMGSLPQLIATYINARVRARDFSDLAGRFLPWVQHNERLSASMITRVTSHCTANKEAVDAIFNIIYAIMGLKNSLVDQLDSYQGDVIAHIQGARGGEGYVVNDFLGPLKYVNRAHFSAANFQVNDQ